MFNKLKTLYRAYKSASNVTRMFGGKPKSLLRFLIDNWNSGPFNLKRDETRSQ